MSNGHCLIHGAFVGFACPTCSTAGSVQFPYYPQESAPTVTWNQTGWKCPSCGCGVAPFMPYCPHCAPKKAPDVAE